MGPAATETDVERHWIRVAATRDEDTADRWRDAVEAAGLSVEVHIEDMREALPGSSAIPDLVLGAPFAYGLWIPPDERQQAVRALIDAGWDGRHGSVDAERPPTHTIVRGALLALVAAAAVVIARMALS